MPDYKLFSADSHVSEPTDLWVTRIDKDFAFRAPRVETREKDGKLQDFFIYEGFPPHPVAVGLAAAARQGNKDEFRESGKGYTEALRGGWDPVARLIDQDTDGVDGEVLHTTLGFRLFWLKDAALQRACFQVYNDWLAEYCSHSPARLIGVPLISLHDIDLAREELRRCTKIGLHGAMIWLSPPADCPPYSSPIYDPFWAEAQELGAPLVLHAITGGAESRYSINYWDPNAMLGPVVSHHEAERTLATLILSGVLERFPRLKILPAEVGTDWYPTFLARLDRVRERPGVATFPTKLTLTPREYFHRQMFPTYIKEPGAVENRHVIGVDNLMWSSDYPHNASSWPRSQEIVDEATASIPAEERRKLVRDNALRVYDLAAVAV